VLHLASINGNYALVAFLLANGADVDARCIGDKPPLLLAIFHGNTHLIPVLLGHGADTRAYNENRTSPFHFLVLFDRSDHDVAKLLLEHRADANAADDSGSTPLHCCLNWPINTTLPDDIWKVKILLENGADVNALSRDGISIEMVLWR
jgi:ankyrin repeat protein